MRLSYVLVVALIAGTGLAQSADAKSLVEGATPVNFPPADFEGRSFVDNDGCIYIRAGVDGNTTWVPRVSRNRQVICGQTPSFGTTRVATAAPTTAPEVAAPAPATAAAPAAAPAPAPRQAAAPTPQPAAAPAAATPPARVAQPAPAPVATPAPVPAPTTRVVRRVVPAPAAPAAPVVAAAPAAPATDSGTLSVVTPGIVPCSERPGARCGPQTQSPSSGWRVLQPGEALPQSADGELRVARVVSVPPVPEGYRPIWDDGRLNPQRGIPTTSVVAGFVGKGRVHDLAWTRKPPHLLYDRNTGLVVGDQYPGLTYPNTDTSSITQRDLAVAYRPATQPAAAAAPAAQPQGSVVSTRSAPQAAQPAARPLSQRHVQVAIFGDIDAARAAAKRFAARGMAAKIGQSTRSGAARFAVILGPFNTAGEVDRALRMARGQGFTNAKARK
ncbi:MAG: SPOR domain-containing protein [Pseudomonadota bacterium]